MATQVEHIKWVPGTNFMVDGFRFQNERCRHYFLTHSHGDHTTGLKKSFDAGTIYCTPITAKLLVEESRIPQDRVQSVNLDEPFDLDGCRITAVCANHCPGACMFLFQLQKPGSSLKSQASTAVLHTGDFRCGPSKKCRCVSWTVQCLVGLPALRAGLHLCELCLQWFSSHACFSACSFHDAMPLCQSLKDVTIDTLMLDTTYSTPKWAFPDQDTAVSSAVEIIQKAQQDNDGEHFTSTMRQILQPLSALLNSTPVQALSSFSMLTTLARSGATSKQHSVAVCLCGSATIDSRLCHGYSCHMNG